MDLKGYINEARSVLRTGFKRGAHTHLTRVCAPGLRAVVGRPDGRRMYPIRRPTGREVRNELFVTLLYTCEMELA